MCFGEQKEFQDFVHHLFRNSFVYYRWTYRQGLGEIQSWKLETLHFPQVFSFAEILYPLGNSIKSEINKENDDDMEMARLLLKRLGLQKERGGRYGLKEETGKAWLSHSEEPWRLQWLRVRDQGLICHQHERCQRGLSKPSSKQLFLPVFHSLAFIILNVI